MAEWTSLEQFGSDVAFLASLKNVEIPELHEITGVVQISEIASKLWALGWQVNPSPPMPIFQTFGGEAATIALTFSPVQPFIHPDGGVKTSAWIQMNVYRLDEDFTKLSNLEFIKATVNIREAV
jgi:hypothetical protein